ncbi:hypothetical protein TNCV_1032391 [Trichonephila clavipes]|nr:hypothetical protein TNCV_1032391 [Trichonephila clavipes]
MAAMDRNGPIPFFKCQTRVPSESDPLARKNALWSHISHALPATTPGREQHLSTLQGTQSIESTLDAVSNGGSSLCQDWNY